MIERRLADLLAAALDAAADELGVSDAAPPIELSKPRQKEHGDFATNLALVTFARVHGNLDGQVAAFFVMVVAAAEVVVGLAIIMTIFRTRRSASVDDASLLKY